MPPVVAVQGLVPGEAGLSGQPPPFGSGPAGVLGLEQVGEEAELARGRVLDGLPGHAVRQRQVARQGRDLFGCGPGDHSAAALARLAVVCAHARVFRQVGVSCLVMYFFRV